MPDRIHFAGGLLLGLLIQQFVNFTEKLPALSEKIFRQLDQIGIRLDQMPGINIEDRKSWIKTMLSVASQQIVQQLPQSLYATSISAVLVLLVPVYATLILYYRNLLVNFVCQIVPVTWKQDIQVVLPEVVYTYFDFIKGMAIVYLVGGILNSIGLFILGIPLAILVVIVVGGLLWGARHGAICSFHSPPRADCRTD